MLPLLMAIKTRRPYSDLKKANAKKIVFFNNNYNE